MPRAQSSTPTTDSVPKLLKIIIRLLIETQVSAKKMTMTDAVKVLNSMGLGPTEIGEIVGWSKGSVWNVLSGKKVKTND